MVGASRPEQVEHDLEVKPIFQGEKVHLIAPEPEQDAGLFARWMKDADFVRLMDSDPARLFSIDKHKEWLEKDLVDEQKDDAIFFLVRTIQGEKTIGLIGLDGIRWVHGDAWVGIGLGERDYWGKGFGTDAMLVLQRYAFLELNLHRLSLTVFEYNERAISSYKKAGFTEEGRARQYLNRNGNRYNMIFMGILREEWERR